MKRFFNNTSILIAMSVLCFSVRKAIAQPPVATWWNEYSAADATGPDVLGFWKFDSDGKGLLADQSSHKHQATLHGARYHADGRFGGCLESSVGYPVIDESHSMHIAQSSTLSPTSPFSTEMWIRPKTSTEEFPNNVRPVLLDMKYVPTNHTGFMLSMSLALGGKRQLLLSIGLGERSETWNSRPIELSSQWQHIAFTYDAHGTASFYLNGSLINSVYKKGAGPMATAVRPLSIGDRIGSNYNGFPGYIDEVRIARGLRDFRPIQFVPQSSRYVFVRMNQQATIIGNVVNQTDKPLSDATITIELPSSSPQSLAVPTLAAGQRHHVAFPVDASLKPGEYEIPLKVEIPKWSDRESRYQSKTILPMVIVPRPLPYRMPVVMWGIGGTDEVVKETPRLKEIGFTHCLGLRADYQRFWDEGDHAIPSDKSIRDGRKMLDHALENDLRIVVSLSPGSWLRKAEVGKTLRRIDRKGNHDGHKDISGLFPEVQTFCFNTGAAMGKAFGDQPALAAALLHSEVRGESQVSFHPAEIAAYERATGATIPDLVTNKNGVDYTKLKDFPADRVIADEHPIRQYLKWFWKTGDGWNDLNTQTNKGLKTHIKHDDFWTFHDPACRVPSLGGSGGGVDVLSHWTYSYPDPIRIGLCTDELFEMASAGGRNQQVMKMTQLIWYRSQTAPIGAVSAESGSVWVDQDPDAAYITIAPMHLREAFWWKLARPIQGIMYHGWQSLVETESQSSYRYTNPSTQHELKRLIRDVVIPLGPSLMQIPDAPSDVVFLESFTSQMFAHRGTYGWNGSWAGDLYHVLMYAQLQPRVMYEESLLAGDLQGAKVLVMADCDVLTKSAVAAIQDFQAAGGLVIGDADVCPAIRPDKTIVRFNTDSQADKRRTQLIAAATNLRSWLDAKYLRAVDSDNADVVTRRRQFGTTDYIFAVNDSRDFGSYVGNYGLVMEDGLPSQATIRLNRDNGFVYDLRTSRRLATHSTNRQLTIPVKLGPCEGKLLMVTQRKIRDLQVTVPETAKRGDSIHAEVAITDGQTPIDAVIPVHVQISDSEGMEAERSGYYGVAGGRLSIPIDCAPNDHVGLWQIDVEELASGKTSSAYFKLQ